MTGPSVSNSLAAALSAAAEIARTSGGVYILPGSCDNRTVPPENAEMTMLEACSSAEQDSSEKASFCPHTDEPSQVESVLFQPISDGSTHSESPAMIGEPDEDTEKRLARSRERNREHARRTRLRKKAHLESLQVKVHKLEEEGKLLKQSIEECSIASILIGLASGSHKTTDTFLDTSLQAGPGTSSSKVMQAFSGKRKRFLSEDSADNSPQPMKLNIAGRTTWIGGGRNHINWKTGVYCDEKGEQRQLTQDQLEALRRERNRMHAKMTRDRKKNFISAVESTIQDLETENQQMRDTLAKVASMTGVTVSPMSSPLQTSTPRLSPEPDCGSVASDAQSLGWSLVDV